MHPFLNIAIQAARNAGKIITRHYEQLDASKVSEKGLNDLVTTVDKAAEKTIIETITKAYPYHTILGEESGLHPGNEVAWVIDPIDGTMNFVHGFPQFAVSIGVKQKEQIEHAVIYDPLSQELFTASKGAGAQLNNRRIRVSNRENLRNALIAADFCFYHQDEKQKTQHVRLLETVFARGADTRKNGSAALNLAYVASGRFDGFWESGLKEWDIAAGVLLVREAGGFVSDFNGENNFLKNGHIIAGTRKVYTELAEIISENKA